MFISRMMSYPYPQPYPTAATNPLGAKTPSFLSIARHIHSREGFRGFYRGLGPCLLRAFPANACALFVYEGVLRGLAAEKVGLLYTYCLCSAFGC